MMTFARISVKALSASGCALAAMSVATIASAQTAPPAYTATTSSGGLAEIVVTAQKRSQNLQDVPVAVTALPSKALQANRITSVTDLGTAVPNLASRPTAGGAQTPAFTMRGITSYGVVPGSDKELSIYIDGVYIGSTVGSGLDLPEVDRIEVLRGPQGTLFGRNATIGAISVVTRDPPSKFGVNQEFTMGNYDEVRAKTRVDLGSWGPFSATVSYLHDERKGDIRNLGAGTTLTYPESAGIPTTQTSPKYLGDKNLNAFFVAVKFAPSTDFSVVNKFDWTGNHYTPSGAGLVGFNPDALGPEGAAFLEGILATQPTPPTFVTDGKRPKAVNNSFSMPSYNRDWGDSLTAQYRLTDHLTIKNIAAYRKTYVRASNQIDGAGGLTVQPPFDTILGAPAGSPFVILGIQQVGTSRQFSDEVQVNYSSRLLTLTAGALYFNLKTQSGGAPGLPNNVTLGALPGGLDTATASNPQSRAFNTEKSIAGYAQAEVHIMPQLDVVGGIRVNQDKKTGDLVGGYPDTTHIDFAYKKTKPSYSAGVNYKPTRDILLYGKYSTAFVSGGAAGPIVFKPETAKSWEAGIKADWLDHHLRTNLALYDVHYKDLQTAQAGITLGYPEIGLAIADLGNEHARGFEFESTAVPIKNVTLGAAVGYTDAKFTKVNPIIPFGDVFSNKDNFLPTLIPKWTVNLSGEYDTPPLFGETIATFRIDASWRSRERTNSNVVQYDLHQYDSVKFSPATWLVNARVSLDKIHAPFGDFTLALWAKNLNNAKEITFPDILGGFIASTEFQQARTYGLDVIFNY
ncbi:TonB-dependent receptor [Nostoc sp. 3335mG]|nr:TonB-dependent receptor [Nostoc sp. 3335mG]